MSGQLFPGRIDYLLGSNAGFKHLHGAILLAQAYPGATPPRLWRPAEAWAASCGSTAGEAE